MIGWAVIILIAVIVFVQFHAGPVREPARLPPRLPVSAPARCTSAISPDFTLAEVHDADKPESMTLSMMADKGPVVVVFYLSYSCSRCVTHLKEMGDLLPEFEKAGLQVVAISPDTPANTRLAETLRRYSAAAAF